MSSVAIKTPRIFRREETKYKKKSKVTPGWVLLYIFMAAMVVFTALPLIYLINTAFKPMDELYIFPPRYLVRNPSLRNFRDLVLSLSSSAVPFMRYFFNSFLVTVTVVVFTVFVSSIGAYSLSKFKPPGSKSFFDLVIALLMFPSAVTAIPSYMVINSLGLVDTYWALILPYIAVPYNFFLMKQFVDQFPNELLEAGWIDGAGDVLIYWKILMPGLAPAWSTLIVFSFVNNWNNYSHALTYITNQALRTLPLAMNTIGGGAATASIGRAGAVAAATMLMTIPTVVIFVFMQRHVMETMVHSGIKG